MKCYVQFLTVGVMSGELREACGNDSVFILDGRKTLKNKIYDALVRLDIMKKYAGFKVVNATNFRDKGFVVTTYVLPEHKHRKISQE